MKKERGR
jgi:hypothetical protein